MDEVEKLYEKILDNEDWEMEDLDKLLELVRAEGYTCGKLYSKGLLRECYNTLSNSTGLDGVKVTTESSLTRRLREAIDE
ncbi:MAG: hypothetical protein KH414_15750 [Tannerella sp.]|jgi:hypothetical protein|uniref:hypothetical protein n=1 Tax=Bacteroides sp. HMSC068A09 TaxID=1739319 RepID=UPI0008A4EF64|nr:hypothetical protein [Bacteroides sp. HMSC068A09]MBS6411979.1 hypothetical protein [Tannerella sp.]OFK48621.1 hypothetical protein HMPREF2815_09030 [Bacteroides sp. HMSC068A09]